MIDNPPAVLRIQGITGLWFKPKPVAGSRRAVYRPAVLAECTLNFRSLRAGLNHSEDRSFTAWLPERELAIDWDAPAVHIEEGTHLESQPEAGIGFAEGNFASTKDEFQQYLDELVDRLIRNERLRLYYNPVFGLFSSPEDELEDFLYRVAEAALRRVEPELKQLRNKFDLHLEQIREAQSRRGLNAESVSLDKLQLSNLHLSESENRLTSIFSTLAGTVFGTTEAPSREEHDAENAELQEDLQRVEHEARKALRSLYEEYMALANEYDVFEIGLQPDNIQVLRIALLWVPVAS
ncbi:MAG TPA: hypothetical protein VJX67_15050 [Blastocatellia bacterium]|nr:hypothetical protein [Blastocatellia bacterium]